MFKFERFQFNEKTYFLICNLFLLINDYCFEQLGCQKLMAVVKSDNQGALNYNLKLGYKIVKQSDLIEIELNFEDYQQHSQTLKHLLSREKNRN